MFLQWPAGEREILFPPKYLAFALLLSRADISALTLFMRNGCIWWGTYGFDFLMSIHLAGSTPPVDLITAVHEDLVLDRRIDVYCGSPATDNLARSMG